MMMYKHTSIINSNKKFAYKYTCQDLERDPNKSEPELYQKLYGTPVYYFLDYVMNKKERNRFPHSPILFPHMTRPFPPFLFSASPFLSFFLPNFLCHSLLHARIY
jgi:hypothetical protein